MKDNTVHGLKSKYNVYSNTINRFSCKKTESIPNRDCGCQANYNKDYKRDNCTCKRHKKTQFTQGLAISKTRLSFIDFGVERIKLVPRKVKKLYLPDNLSIKDYYLTKKLSSKCVGGAIPDKSINRKSIAISQQNFYSAEQNRDICSESRCFKVSGSNISPHRSANLKTEKINIVKKDTNINISQELSNRNTELDIIKEFNDPLIIDNERIFSSDSLIQHIYNLDTPSLEKHSRTSIAPIENKLEREYRKMFSLKPKHKKSRCEKPIPDNKSVSFMEKSLEALKKGLSWTRESPKDLIVNEKTSQISVLSHKDVSIASDPPSLEARSISNTNIYSPQVSFLEPNIIKVQDGSVNNRGKEIIQNECKEIVAQDAKTMFSIWGKKFNFENENLNKIDKKPKPFKPLNPDVTSPEEKKKGNKIFSFFKKKNKEKSKDPFKGKNVTAGRCELGDGIVINIGVDNNRTLEPIVLKMDNVTNKQSNFLQKSWLNKFISKPVDARKSVQIRWGNKFYGTSSSTVFELKDCAHKDTTLMFRSKSEIACIVSSFYDDFTKPKVNFMQDIKAWMMPKTICDTPIVSPNSKNKNCKQNNNINISFCNENGVIEKYKGQNIEYVMHSNNIIRKLEESSEYITINIPEGYFSEDSDYQRQSTDEEVYNIVEYEAQKSKSDIKRMVDQQVDTGENIGDNNNIKVTISFKESHESHRKTPPKCRDVVIQGSDVYTPNAFDVIGVGIITQKDLRHRIKPIIKIQDYLTDEDSEHIFQSQKKCDLAESYLQDYYRNIMPLGLDLYTSYGSESQLRITSEHSNMNSNKILNNEDSESCSNIYDGYQASINSSYKMSCTTLRKEPDEIKRNKFFNKLIRIPCDFASHKTDFLRVYPKDSLEVFKRRKVNACSNKSNWGKPGSVDNYGGICHKPCSKKPLVKKQVTLPSSDSFHDDTCNEGILQYKGSSSNCKPCKSSESVKNVKVIPKPVCEIPQPPFKDSCESLKKPPCSKKNSRTATTPPRQISDLSSACRHKCTSPCASSKILCASKVPRSPPRRINSPININKKYQTSSTGSSGQICKPFSPSKSCDRIRSQTENETTTSPSRESWSSPKRKCKCPINKHGNKTKNMIKRMINKINSGQCKPNCPNNAKSQNLPNDENCPKLTGVHLKMKPAVRNSNSKECDIVNLNSKENIMIRLKQECPSTEAIQQGCNIRVQDEDGRTLYERKDYKRTTAFTKTDKSSLVRDMYRDSLNVNRVSAANIVNDEKCLDAKEVKSNLSILNAIEINLTLKFKQTDKNTDLNPNCNDEEKSNIQGIIGSPKEVYVFGKENKQISNDRKDLNLNITIQNLNPKSNSSNKNVGHNYLTTKISDKNISTSYSDCMLLHQRAYSVHRTSIDVNSIDTLDNTTNYEESRSKDKMSTAKTSIMSSINNDKKNPKNNSITSKASISILSDFNSNKEEEGNIFSNIQDEYEIANVISDVNESIQDIVSKKLVSILKKLSRNEKKDVLKQIFETMSNIKEKHKKTKFKKIQHLLHAVLTSDSSEVSCKETESVQSHCHYDSVISMNISSKNISMEQILHKKGNNGSSDSNDGSCLCSHIEKCNVIHNNNLGCCCRNKNEIDQNISNRSKLVEVETQDSRNFKLESVIMTNVSTTMEIQSENVNAPIKKHETRLSNHNTREIKRINEQKLLYFASDKVLFFLSDSADTIENDTKYFKKPEDILQLKETKKAVLEIYSQKRISNSKGDITARLPKFVSYKQSQLRSYKAVTLD